MGPPLSGAFELGRYDDDIGQPPPPWLTPPPPPFALGKPFSPPHGAGIKPGSDAPMPCADPGGSRAIVPDSFTCYMGLSIIGRHLSFDQDVLLWQTTITGAA